MKGRLGAGVLVHGQWDTWKVSEPFRSVSLAAEWRRDRAEPGWGQDSGKEELPGPRGEDLKGNWDSSCGVCHIRGN